MTHQERYDRDDPLVGALFSASREEAPSARALEKTLAAVGAATALSAAAATQAAASALATEKSASAIGWGLLAKWTGVGLGAGLLTAGAAGVAERWVAPPAATPVAAVVQVAARNAARPVLHAPPPRTTNESAAAAATAELVRPGAPAAAAWNAPGGEVVTSARAAFDDVPGSKPAPVPRAAEALRPELVCIDRARAALGAGSFAEARALSERCEREHPGGQLALEALLVRMHALEGLGQSAAARAVAKQLIDAAPKSPHAARARALLEAGMKIP